MFNNLINKSMVIEFETAKIGKKAIKMGRLKSGCSCWNDAWFNG